MPATKPLLGEIQEIVKDAPHGVALRLRPVQNRDRFGGSVSTAGMALASLSDRKEFEVAGTSKAQEQSRPQALKPPLPVKSLLKSLQNTFDAKQPSAPVKRYTSPKTGRRLLPPQFHRGDKVGFKQTRIACMCSDEWTYDPYNVCDTKVNKSDDYLHLVAVDLNGIDGAWVKGKDLKFYQKLEARSWD